RQQPARDQEIARAFGRALAQNGGFDLEESFRIKILPRGLRDAMADLQIAREPWPAQVVVAISQFEIFVAQFGVELERQIFRPVHGVPGHSERTDKSRKRINRLVSDRINKMIRMFSETYFVDSVHSV